MPMSIVGTNYVCGISKFNGESQILLILKVYLEGATVMLCGRNIGSYPMRKMFSERSNHGLSGDNQLC